MTLRFLSDPAPNVQAVGMFLGEFSCLAVFYLLLWHDRRSPEPRMNPGQSFNPLLFFPPAMCDMTATSTMYVGKWVSALALLGKGSLSGENVRRRRGWSRLMVFFFPSTISIWFSSTKHDQRLQLPDAARSRHHLHRPALGGIPGAAASGQPVARHPHHHPGAGGCRARRLCQRESWFQQTEWRHHRWGPACLCTLARVLTKYFLSLTNDWKIWKPSVWSVELWDRLCVWPGIHRVSLCKLLKKYWPLLYLQYLQICCNSVKIVNNGKSLAQRLPRSSIFNLVQRSAVCSCLLQETFWSSWLRSSLLCRWFWRRNLSISTTSIRYGPSGPKVCMPPARHAKGSLQHKVSDGAFFRSTRLHLWY